MWKLVRWMAYLILALVLLIVGFLYYIEPTINGSEKHAKKIFEEVGFNYSSAYTSIGVDSLHSIISGNDSAQTLILFFHGAPGSWADFSSFLSDSVLHKTTLMISMDRFGYGTSRYGHIEKSIPRQVEAAHEIIKQYPRHKIILVGYSYGGPIAASYAARYPDQIKALLLLAPVIHPDKEKLFWFNKVIEINMIRYLLPAYISAANDEKLSHAKALNEIRDDWNHIQIPVVHLHCTDDWIAPFKDNTDWSKDHIDISLLINIQWKGDNHFLPNHIGKRIKPILNELVK